MVLPVLEIPQHIAASLPIYYTIYIQSNRQAHGFEQHSYSSATTSTDVSISSWNSINFEDSTRAVIPLMVMARSLTNYQTLSLKWTESQFVCFHSTLRLPAELFFKSRAVT